MLLCHSRELFAGSSWCLTRTSWISRMSSSTLLKQFGRRMTRSESSSTRYLSMHVYNFKQEKELIIYTGRHDDPPTADEGLRGPALVLVKDLRQSWGRGISCIFCTHLQSTSTHYYEVEKKLIDCVLQVSRVYVGSFWSQPLRYVANRELFEAEQVLNDIFSKQNHCLIQGRSF